MDIKDIVKTALKEDIGNGDHTSIATIPYSIKGKANLLIKEHAVFAGLPFAVEVFNQVDPHINIEIRIEDGAEVFNGDIAFTVEGAARSIVTAERTALNFLQRISGIATETNKLTRLISEYNTKLLDTRKTSPGLRIMEKYGVKKGGGENHRMGLYDMIMIKDNHVDFAGGIKEALKAVLQYQTEKKINIPVEIEVRNLEELQEVLDFGNINRIMLDNFEPEMIFKALKMIDNRYETEASGNITEDNIVQYAATGVNFISMGSLTHQIKSVDMSLKAVQ